MSKTRIRPLVLAILLTVLALALYTGYTLMWRLLLLVSPIVLAGYLWVRMGLRDIEIIPGSFQTRCQVGETLTVGAVVSNRSVIPKFMMKIRQAGSLPNFDNRLALNLPGKTSYDWQTTMSCGKRGRFTMSPISLEVSDPFGVFCGHRHVGKPQNVLVYPAVKELALTPLQAYGDSHSSHNRWLTNRSGADVSRIREYAHGDSMNRIHWKSTAHAGHLMVKDFCEDRVRNVWILLDMNRGSTQGDRASSKIEHKVTVAASLAKFYVEKGYPVGLISEGDKPQVLTPRPGEKHYWFLMEELATIRAEGITPLAEIISRESQRFRSGSLTFVITDNLDDRLLSRLRKINEGGANAVLMIPDGVKQGVCDYQGLWRHFAVYNVPAYLAG